ncbi:IS1595 family transposase [Allgaiera indica]|nr:Transposase zinc-ribbon domain-containing protein [Allgaiera indica]
MITELKSVRDLWKKMPTERQARIFLEQAIWAGDRFCPHCGSLGSTRLRGDSTRAGLCQCAEKECRRQFTVTTKAPLHTTKLDLRIWIATMFFVLTSSKGISSVVMARILGVNQKTAWKLGHAIRELMDDREGIAGRLSGIVDVDEAFVGGKPKFEHGVKNKRGRGTGKPIVLVAAARNGQARAFLVPNAQGRTMGPVIKDWIDPDSVMITDKNSPNKKIGAAFAGHMTVQRNKHEYADRRTGAHINTAEAVNAVVQRALIGVYPRLVRQHLHRYLDEILRRWNHRKPTMKVRTRKSASGHASAETTTVWKPIPVVDQMRGLLRCAVGRGMRRTPVWGLRWP